MTQVVGAQRSKRWLTIATGLSLLVIAATAVIVFAVANLEDGPLEAVPKGVVAVTRPAIGEPDQGAGSAAAPAPADPAALPASEVLDQTGFDIMVEPRGASVSLDGNPIGAAPLRVRRLVPGLHTIEVSGVPGHGKERRTVQLRPGQAEVVRIILPPAAGEAREPDAVAAAELPAEAPRRLPRRAPEEVRRPPLRSGGAAAEGATGILMLNSKPPCQILIDGERTGLSTPHRSIKLPAGRHVITLINPEHGIRERFTVTIRPGKATRVIKNMSDQLR